ncbi:MAG: ZIP family metal transporter [Candidatus Omnitrophota bacterium]
MNPSISALISVSLVSIISLAGAFTLSLNKEFLRKILLFLVSFAVGALFGDAFIHLLPEAFEELGLSLQTSLLVISGILIFFVLEKFLRWRHCHILESSHEHVHPMATLSLIGDAVHNLMDGMIIGASYLASPAIGVATTLAVILHEIPQEIGDFGILVHSGLTVRKALFFNFLSALTAFVGLGISLFIGPHITGYASYIVPVTAGGFLYIAGSDLIPELHHDVKASISLGQFVCIILGVGLMALLVLME